MDRRTRRIAIVVGLAGLTVLTAGTALASIPDANGVIHACVRNDGSVVVKDDHETGTIPCGAQATPIQWNVSGPAGPTGPPGPAGATDFTFTGATFYVPVGAPLRKVIGCPAGRRAVAGGFAATADAVRVVASEPEETAINETPMAGGPPPRTGWAVTFVNTGPNAELATASAVCAAIG